MCVWVCQIGLKNVQVANSRVGDEESEVIDFGSRPSFERREVRHGVRAGGRAR